MNNVRVLNHYRDADDLNKLLLRKSLVDCKALQGKLNKMAANLRESNERRRARQSDK